MIKWLQDSYNGVYKILLKPHMPSLKSVALLVGGLLLGLVVAYVVFPTIYYDADPRTLEQSWQDEWVKLLADRNAAANADVSGLLTNLLTRVDDPLGIVDRLSAAAVNADEQQRLLAIRPYAEQAQPSAVQAPQPNTLQSLIPFIVAPLIVIILTVIISLLYNILIYPNIIEPAIKRSRGDVPSAEVAQIRQQVATQRAAEATLKTNFTTSDLGAPIFQRMSSYQLGFGQYDMSYSIEDASARFLGECGVSSSETIGVGEPEKTTAAEVWLFDKEDFQKTVTKVFISPHANTDPGLRARLEPRGDLIVAQVGAVAILETATLRLQARVVDVEYGPGPLPPNSYFQRITIELAAWRKDGVGVPVAAPAQTVPAPVVAMPTMPVQAAPVFTPAPVIQPPPLAQPYTPPPTLPQPAPSFRPAQPQTPLPPPPPPPRPRVDDDPFGGTGDFTPVS